MLLVSPCENINSMNIETFRSYFRRSLGIETSIYFVRTYIWG